MSSPTSSRSLCLPPARMHFCVSATRGGFHAGFCCPRKIGTNWFIPAFVKSRFGESGSNDAEGTIVCFFSRKKSKKDWRISAAVMIDSTVAAVYDRRQTIRSEEEAASLLLLFVEPGFHCGLDLFVKRGIVLQRVFTGIATLGELRAFVAEPRAALLDDLFLEREIEERPGRGNTLVVHDVELGFGERRRDFVLHHFHAGPVSGNRSVRLFDRANPADVDSDARVKLQRFAAGSGFRIAEHDTDLLADLVREYATRPRL